MMSTHRIPAVVLALMLCGASLPTGARAVPAHALHDDDFAVVNGYTISGTHFVTALRREARQRFYHGRVTEERFEILKQDVAQQLLDNALLAIEAERLQIAPDGDQVEQELLRRMQRYAADPAWLAQERDLTDALREQIEARERIRLLEAQVRNGVEPDEARVRAYYQQNPELFTVPEQLDVAAILIRVPPTSTAEEWLGAESLANELRRRIESGESFAVLAREYSDDPSAERGGAMGLQHRGMLHADVEAELSAIEPGELTQPVRLLEGYVLAQLIGRKPELLNGYQESRERARELLVRHLAEEAWQEYLITLRNEAQLEVNERFMKLTLD